VSSWGIWEAVRELIQNAADEAQERPEHVMTVEHVDGWLHIANKGADLGIQALLIGGSDKAGKRGLRGQHGEGLDLALLCAARAGVEVRVSTKTDVWTPCAEYAEQYGARCLVVNTRKHVKPRDGVKISIHIDKDSWESMRSKFLFLDPPKEQIESDSGTLILDANRKGMIYVKGIYVMTGHNTSFGFDLRDVTLDRDRRVIGSFDLQWACSRIIQNALSRNPDTYTEPVMNLLEQGSDDVRFLHSHLETGGEARKSLAKAFRARHGEDAMAVQSLAESQQLAHFGVKGVVVNEATANVLASELGSYSDAAARLRQRPTALYGWDDLTDAEKAVYEDGVRRMAPVAGEHMAEACKLKVCDFADKSIEGTCDLATSEIHVSRRCMGNVFDLVEVMVHELAHAVSSANDGTVGHIRAIERIWRKLYEHASAPKTEPG
jgi:hypothetical protein